MERYYAAEGLKNALGREAAARIASRLTDEHPGTIEAVCTALEVITGQPFNQLDVKGTSYRVPNTPEEWRSCRDKWRNWWRVFGQEWIRTGK